MKPASTRSQPGDMPAGRPWPLGVEWVEGEDALNFALYSRHATGVTLLCHDGKDPARPIFEFRFQYAAHKTGSIWHCRIPAGELRGATLYGYRVEGYTCRDAVVYELHVKGFTARENSGVMPAKRGTFAGLTEKIPYLKDLGVTIVELLPVHQFDPQEKNYWGYMSLHFISPHQNRAIFRFFKLMIAFRKAHPSIGRLTFWREDVKWFGIDGPVDFGAESRCLAYTTSQSQSVVCCRRRARSDAPHRDDARGRARRSARAVGGMDTPTITGNWHYFLGGASVGDDDLYVMINGHSEDRTFTVQGGAAPAWRRVIDTSKPSPEDIIEPGKEAELESASYPVRARSVMVLCRERE